MLAELRSGRLMPVVAGLHPSGEVVTLEIDEDIPMMDADELVEGFNRWGAMNLLAGDWPTGQRDNVSSAVGGAPGRLGKPDEWIEQFIHGEEIVSYTFTVPSEPR